MTKDQPSRLRPPSSLQDKRSSMDRIEIDLTSDEIPNTTVSKQPCTPVTSSSLPLPSSSHIGSSLLTRIPAPSGLPRKTSRPTSRQSTYDTIMTPAPLLSADQVVSLFDAPQAASAAETTKTLGLFNRSSSTPTVASSSSSQPDDSLVRENRRLENQVELLNAQISSLIADNDDLRKNHQELERVHSEQLKATKASFQKDIAEMEEQVNSLESGLKHKYEMEYKARANELSEKLAQVISQNQVLSHRLNAADAIETECKFQIAEMKDMSTKLESHSSTFLKSLSQKGHSVPVQSLDQVDLDPNEIDVAHFSPGTSDFFFSAGVKYILVLEKLLLSQPISTQQPLNTQELDRLKEQESIHVEQIQELQNQLMALQHQKEIVTAAAESLSRDNESQLQTLNGLKLELDSSKRLCENLKMTLGEQEDGFQSQLELNAQEKSVMSDRISQLEAELTICNQDLETLQTQHQAHLDGMLSQSKLLEAQLQASESQHRDAQQSIKKLQDEVDKLTQERTTLQETLSCSTLSQSQLSSTITELQGRLELEKMEAETLVEQNFSLREEIQLREESIQRLKVELQKVSEQLSSTNSPLSSKNETELEKMFSVFESQLTTLKEELNQSTDVINSQGLQIIVLETSLAQAQQDLTRVQEEKHALETEHSSTVALVAEKDVILEEYRIELDRLNGLEKEYQSLSVDKQQLLQQTRSLEEQYQAVDAKRLQLLEECQNVERHNQLLTDENSQLLDQFRKSEVDLQATQGQLNDIRVERDDMSAQLLELKVDLDGVRTLNDKLESEKTDLMTQHLQLVDELASVNQELAEIRTQLEAAAQSHAHSTLTMESKLQESQVLAQQMQDDHQKQLEELQAQKQEIESHSRAELHRLQGELTRLSDECNSSAQKIQGLEAERNDTATLLTQVHESHRLEVEKLQTELATISHNIQRLEDERDITQSLLLQTQDSGRLEIEKLQTELESLRARIDSAEHSSHQDNPANVIDEEMKRLAHLADLAELERDDTETLLQQAQALHQQDVFRLQAELQAAETKFNHELERLGQDASRLLEVEAEKHSLVNSCRMLELERDDTVALLNKQQESYHYEVKTLKEQIQQMEIRFKVECDHYKLQISSVTQELQELQSHMNEERLQFEKQLSVALNEDDQKALHDRINTLESERNDAVASVQMAKEFHRDEVFTLTEQIQQLESQLLESQVRYQQLLASSQEETAALRGKLKELESDRDIALSSRCESEESHRQAIQVLQSQIEQTQLSFADEKSQLEGKVTHLQQLTSDIEALQADQIKTRAQLEKSSLQFEHLLEEKKQLEEHLVVLNKQFEDVSLQRTQFQELNQSHVNQIQVLQNQIHELSASVSDVELQMQERRKRFDEQVQEYISEISVLQDQIASVRFEREQLLDNQTSANNTRQMLSREANGVLSFLKKDVLGVKSTIDDLKRQYHLLHSYCTGREALFEKTLNESQEAASGTIAQLEMDLEDAQQRNVQYQQLIESASSKEKEIVLALDLANSQVLVLQEQIRVKEDECMRYKSDLERFQAEREQLQDFGQSSNEKVLSLESNVAQLKMDLAIMTQDRDFLATELAKTKRELEIVSANRFELDSDLARTRERVAELTQRQSDTQDIIDRTADECCSLGNKIKDSLNVLLNVESSLDGGVILHDAALHRSIQQWLTEFDGLEIGNDFASVFAFLISTAKLLTDIQIENSSVVYDRYEIMLKQIDTEKNHLQIELERDLATANTRQNELIIDQQSSSVLMTSLNELVESLRNETDSLQSQLKSVQAEVDDREAALETARRQIQDLQKTLAEETTRAADLETKLTTLHSDHLIAEKLTETLESLHKESASLKTKIRELESTASQRVDIIQSLENDKDRFEHELTKKDSQVSALQTQIKEALQAADTPQVRPLLIDLVHRFVDKDATVEDISDGDLVQIIVNFLDSLAQTLDGKVNEIKQFEDALQLAQSLIQSKDEELEAYKKSASESKRQLKEQIETLTVEASGKIIQFQQLKDEHLKLQKNFETTVNEHDATLTLRTQQLDELTRTKHELEQTFDAAKVSYVNELKSLNQSLVEVKKDLRKYSDVERVDHQTQTGGESDEITDDDYGSSISSLQRKLEEQISILKAKECELSHLEERFSLQKAELDTLSFQYNAVQALMKEKDTEVVDAVKKIQQLEVSVKQFEAKQAESENKETLLTQLTLSMNQLEQRLKDQVTEMENLKCQLTEMKRVKESLEQKISALSESQDGIAQELQICQEQKMNVESMYDTLNCEYLKVVKEKRTIEHQFKSLQRTQGKLESHSDGNRTKEGSFGLTKPLVRAKPASSSQSLRQSDELALKENILPSSDLDQHSGNLNVESSTLKRHHFAEERTERKRPHVDTHTQSLVEPHTNNKEKDIISDTNKSASVDPVQCPQQ